jgi:presenilin-like A22 family membrane protease
MARRDYKTGFRRLWLVLSVIWAVFLVTLSFQHTIPVGDFLLSLALPIAGLYALFSGVAWVVEGFAKPE